MGRKRRRERQYFLFYHTYIDFMAKACTDGYQGRHRRSDRLQSNTEGQAGCSYRRLTCGADGYGADGYYDLM